MDMLYPNFLAPIDEYTNLPFRLLCQKYGAIATCVPLVNSTAIARGDKIAFVDAHQDEKDSGVQLVGSNVDDIEKAVQEIIKEKPFVKWFNLNCGCPSNKTIGCGGGSALLDRPDLICSAVSAMKRQHDNVSAKIRLNQKKEDTVKLCRMLEKVEVDFIIIHGRTAKQAYSGQCDWEQIKYLKEKLNVKIVGNGDIKTMEQGKFYVENGYCDSFMIGRAAMTNPKVFGGREIGDRLAIINEYIELYGEYVGTPSLSDVKLKAVNFITGVQNASQMRDKICRADTVEKIISIVENL